MIQLTHDIAVYTVEKLKEMGFHVAYSTSPVPDNKGILIHDRAQKIFKDLINLGLNERSDVRITIIPSNINSATISKMKHVAFRCKGRLTKHPLEYIDMYYAHPSESNFVTRGKIETEYHVADIIVKFNDLVEKPPVANRYKFSWGALQREVYLKDGGIHSYDDTPARLVYAMTYLVSGAVRSQLESIQYYKDGILHRERFPAVFNENTARRSRHHYYKEGVNVTDRVQGAILDDLSVDELVWEML